MGTFYRVFIALLLTACLACAHSQRISLEAPQIAKAVQTGAPALPYFVYSGMSLPAVNEAFKAAADVSLEGTYSAAYGFRFADIPANGDTGQAFDNMETASRYLQHILKSAGVTDFQNYLMTSIDTANADGFILIAAIYRSTGNPPAAPLSVFNKFNFLARETLTPSDPGFYVAYRTDTNQNPQDIVYEWAALPMDCVSHQAYQAVLLTLIANSLLEQKAKNDYWSQERQWIAGNHLSVLIKQDIKVSQELGIEKGFTQIRNLYQQ